MRIGVHPNNLHLLLASVWPGGLGDRFSYVKYAEGRDSGALLRDGAIDVCGTGSTPPILAQAAGLDVRTIAASAMRPANGAIVVTPSSPIETIAGLRGKRAALLDGSFHTYLLARALEAEGLSLRDVIRVELSPSASAVAIAKGEVDAWVAMAPHLQIAVASGSVRALAASVGLIPNRSMFWTIADGTLDARSIDAVAEALAGFGEKITADPETAARLLFEARPNDANLAGWRKTVASRDWTITPATANIIAEQQQEADTLVRHGDLDRAITVA